MANIIELKDGSGVKAYPITKAEAVYYDEDYYVDEKIHSLEVEAKTSGTLMPIYIGDYIISNNYLPSALLKIGNYFYVFNAPSNDYALANSTNIGKLRVFDISTNQEVTSKAMDLKMGHANSVCYNPKEDAIYLAPIWQYENSQRTTVSKLYKYDLTFSTVTEIDVPRESGSIDSVFYDYVTGEMYYRIHTESNGAHIYYIYKYTEGSWVLYTSINLANIPAYVISSVDRSYNQDMAIRDNIFYMSCPHGNIIYGELKEGTSEPSGEYLLSNIDTAYLYRIGELEGFEFDEDGHLYAIQYTILTDACFNAFVTEIPVGKSYPTSSSGDKWTTHTGTAEYIGTDDPVFANNYIYVRSINQLRALTLVHSNLRVSAGKVIKEEYPVIIDRSVAIDLRGELQTMRLNVQNGTLTLNGSDANNKIKALNPSTSLISLVERGSAVKIVGQYALNVDLNNSDRLDENFITIGFSYALIITRIRPVRVDKNTLLYIASVPVLQNSLYIGSKNIYYVNESSITFAAGSYYSGFITSAAKEIRFFMPYTKEIYAGGVTKGSLASGSIIVRGPEGYIFNPLNMTDSTYTINMTFLSTGVSMAVVLPTQITPPTSSVFSSYNNIPVSVAVSSSIAIDLTYT